MKNPFVPLAECGDKRKAVKTIGNEYSNREFGNFGESICAAMLEKAGYTVILRNFYAEHGEIDLICEDETHIVFVEVKTRKNTGASLRYGRPSAAVTQKKAMRLLSAAQEYLYRYRPQKRPRIDVFEVYITEAETPEGNVYAVDKTVHFKNAVTET